MELPPAEFEEEEPSFEDEETSGEPGQANEPDFNAFHDLVQTTEPSLLWNLVKDKIAPK